MQLTIYQFQALKLGGCNTVLKSVNVQRRRTLGLMALKSAMLTAAARTLRREGAGEAGNVWGCVRACEGVRAGFEG
jgi:hypothetical protein